MIAELGIDGQAGQDERATNAQHNGDNEQPFQCRCHPRHEHEDADVKAYFQQVRAAQLGHDLIA